MINFFEKEINNEYVVFDIGNSSIKYAVYNRNFKLIKYKFQLTSNLNQKNILIDKMRTFLSEAINLECKQKLILGFVNEEMYMFFKKILLEYFPDSKPYIINNKKKFKTDFSDVDINELGIDLIGLCESNHHKNAVIFSFGTALTTVVIKDNKLISVAIAPGFYESYSHLFDKINKLNRKYMRTNLTNDKGNDTHSALNLGCKAQVYGYIQYFLSKHSINEFQYKITGNDQIINQINIQNIEHVKTEVMDGYLQIFINNNLK
ncbi:type III pantothenate kinase [Mycoplasma sp. CSL7491-lung]|uniref:type III pantothenate kinase n=1 Tax=Mycoplasma sp. CSL7491-lung TaxID=549718 RepID=UPI001C0F5A9C|nr:type III pantothenate kinase [Mycoplasma sp. CSL7491-lung]MBU4693221.1 type III pantothenate kinase [Mycoplasma sp. CSL7491-lung]